MITFAESNKALEYNIRVGAPERKIQSHLGTFKVRVFYTGGIECFSFSTNNGILNRIAIEDLVIIENIAVQK